MKIYRAMFTNLMTQDFAESKACIKLDGNQPILNNGKYVISGKTKGMCPLGYKDFYEFLRMKGHNGYDWLTWHGEPLYFNVEAKTKDGKDVRWVAISEIDSAGGLGVDVFGLDPVYFPECPKELGSLGLIKREWEASGGWLYPK